jgi:hypothetical protein
MECCVSYSGQGRCYADVSGCAGAQRQVNIHRSISDAEVTKTVLSKKKHTHTHTVALWKNHCANFSKYTLTPTHSWGVQFKALITYFKQLRIKMFTRNKCVHVCVCVVWWAVGEGVHHLVIVEIQDPQQQLLATSPRKDLSFFHWKMPRSTHFPLLPIKVTTLEVSNDLTAGTCAQAFILIWLSENFPQAQLMLWVRQKVWGFSFCRWEYKSAAESLGVSILSLTVQSAAESLADLILSLRVQSAAESLRVFILYKSRRFEGFRFITASIGWLQKLRVSVQGTEGCKIRRVLHCITQSTKAARFRRVFRVIFVSSRYWHLFTLSPSYLWYLQTLTLNLLILFRALSTFKDTSSLVRTINEWVCMHTEET